MTNNVITINDQDAHIYVDILEVMIKALIKKDSDDPVIKDYQDLRDRINLAIHDYEQSK